MKRELLKNYLHNKPLMQVITAKKEIDEMGKKLRDALQTMEAVGLNVTDTNKVYIKSIEYKNISASYGAMLGDVWGINWQNESIITKYIDCSDDEIDRLPENIYIK